MQVLPIASGKGGVGKSLVATNLSIALAQAGKQVVLADLDLGASNIHLVLGLGSVREGIGTYLENPGKKINDVVIDSGYENLRFIPGDAEIPGIANIKTSQKRKLLKDLGSLDADYLIMDLGAGTNNNILDFFLYSGQGIVVTAPTLTATLNAYLFLKNAIFRIMSNSFKRNSAAWDYLDKLRQDGQSLQKVYVPKLLERMSAEDPEGFEVFERKMSLFHPGLIMNMLDDPKEGVRAQKIRRSCKEYLGLDLEHLGIIYRDHLQDVALNSRLPIIAYKPQTVLSQAIYRIADKILQQEGENTGPLDYMTLDDSYLTAELEAEIDFDARVFEMEGMLNSGALSYGDLVETIKSQQYEISQLRKENALLKKKIVSLMQDRQDF
ncbi:ATP-binding protein [Marispirochaeta aestuarii]|uniref:ATP-binding protein n=1 Tax=Marispirochaeta aestuarii TaxID=1963862 RepID=A0A1Y1RY80_9SPIO|nr:P-loop NTPase [Marispirochaeta aestuarii]ORC34689.1 ATP-binding protein [Marispirochaeta aestuarii]